jgi:signal peptidase
VVRWGGRLLALAFVALVVAAVVVVVLVPRATKGQAMTVVTGSMTPEIPVGSLAIVRPVDPGMLEVGDVATYQKDKTGDTFVTHRVVDIDTSTRPTTYIFKGDANRGPDLEPIVPDRIVGEVWFHVPYLGTIRDGLKGPGGLTLVAILLLSGYAVSQVRAGVRARRSAAQSFAVDRRMVAARFSRDAGLGPHDLPPPWHALLVQESSGTFTLLAVPPRECFDQVVAEIAALAPAGLTVTEPAGELVLPAPDDLDRDHATVRTEEPLDDVH